VTPGQAAYEEYREVRYGNRAWDDLPPLGQAAWERIAQAAVSAWNEKAQAILLTAEALIDAAFPENPGQPGPWRWVSPYDSDSVNHLYCPDCYAKIPGFLLRNVSEITEWTTPPYCEGCRRQMPEADV
jgi:hypothetical protein